jgi:hypothetical protein
LNGRVCILAESLKKLQTGKTRLKKYKNFGLVTLTKTEEAIEVKFEGGLIILSHNPIWELYLAEALFSERERSKEALEYIASACFIEREKERVKVDNKDFFLNCLFQHKNPLLSVVLGDETNAENV